MGVEVIQGIPYVTHVSEHLLPMSPVHTIPNAPLFRGWSNGGFRITRPTIWFAYLKGIPGPTAYFRLNGVGPPQPRPTIGEKIGLPRVRLLASVQREAGNSTCLERMSVNAPDGWPAKID